jgi:PAS domain S-box-containing protein
MKSFSDIGQEELEAERLRVLREFPELTSEAADPYLDHIVSFAARICDVPIAAVSILDEQRQLFKAIYGLSIRGTERSIAFCNHTIRQNKIFEVSDAKLDRRFRRNPLVESDPNIRFYAGVPLVATGGQKLGTLCVIDREPKVLSSIQRELLMTLSRSVMEYIDHHRERGLLERKIMEMDNFFYLSPDLLCEATMNGYFQKVSRSFVTELGYSEEELLSTPFIELVHPDDLHDTMQVMQQLVEQDKSIAFFHNRYRCKDGHYITLSWNAIPHLPTETIYATARNITKLELLQEEINRNKIREIERSKEKFTTLSQMTKMVSHELLEPANLIIGFADVAEEMIKELAETNDLQEIADLAERIELDLKRIKKHSEFISMVLNKMNSEADWYQIPSVINRKLQF